MIRFRYPLMAAVVAAAVSMLMIPAQSAAEDEQPLIKLLQSDAPKAEKAVACKKLAVWGSAKAVPALAALLPDPEFTSWARIALEAIPGPAASKRLRDAMGNVSGLTLIGVINSMAVRRDAQAVDGLVQHMKGSDAEVASAAAAALGRIGNQAATTALRPMLATAPETVRSAVAEGCILCPRNCLPPAMPMRLANCTMRCALRTCRSNALSRQLGVQFCAWGGWHSPAGRAAEIE